MREQSKFEVLGNLQVVGLSGILGVIFLGLGMGMSVASERRFTYVYEVAPQPKGALEYEQWVTWKAIREADSKYQRFDVRHELEYGITDDLQVALYLADWRYQTGRSVEEEFDYRDTALEWLYKVTDPTMDPVGLAFYQETKLGDELFELEGKVILHKNIDRFAVAYNATLEAEWESKDYDEDKGIFEQTLGASYQIDPSFLVGVEALNEVEFDNWSEQGDAVVYVGPNASYRGSRWWVTLTPLMQVTGIDEEPDFQTRILIGFHLK